MTKHEAHLLLEDAIKSEQLAFDASRYGRTQEREAHYHAMQKVLNVREIIEHTSFDPDPKPQPQHQKVHDAQPEPAA